MVNPLSGMNFSKIKKRAVLYWGIALIFLITILISYLRLFDNYELETLDIRFRLRPDLPVNKDIAIIEIGDDTIDKIGKWPISRRYHAALIDALTEAGAEAIVFDVFFSEESDEKSDALFQDAIKKSGKVYLPYVFNIASKRNREVPVADRLQEEVVDKFKRFAKGTGFINIIPDNDGKFRRIPPFIKYKDTLYPHVCFFVCADYLGFKKEDIAVTPGRHIVLENKTRIPLDLNSTIIVNFPGRWDRTFRHYSFIDVVDSYIAEKFPEVTGRKPIVSLASLKDSICFIGVTATATPDAHPSPFDPLYPGVGVNASLFNSILLGRFIQRASPIVNIGILIFLCLITCLISGYSRTSFSFLFVFFFILTYVIAATAVFFFWGLWVDIFYPVVAMLFFYLGTTFTKYINETHKIGILEKELSIAKKIQESFLPKENPSIPGMEIAAKMLTALQVGGDLYDFVRMGEGKVGVMVGDVSGKGVPAALYMAKVVSEFKSYAAEESPSRVIHNLNERLCGESGSGLFVTLTYVIFDMKTGFLTYSSGGHLPMIKVSTKDGKDSAEQGIIDTKEGMPLGLFDGTFSEERIKYEKGDMCVLYTDGVTEAMNPKGEMFGQERLVGLIRDNVNLKTDQLVDLIQSSVRKFEGKQRQHDDITVICVKRV